MRAGVRAASPAERRHRVCRIRAARQFISILPHFPMRGWDTEKLTSTICGRVQLLCSAETVHRPTRRGTGIRRGQRRAAAPKNRHQQIGETKRPRRSVVGRLLDAFDKETAHSVRFLSVVLATRQSSATDPGCPLAYSRNTRTWQLFGDRVVRTICFLDLIERLSDQEGLDAVTGRQGERRFEKVQATEGWELVECQQFQRGDPA